MERRKDNKGKVLKEGESQRSDGRYQYRYTDRIGKRNTVYAKDLNTLREKEKEIERLLNAGVESISPKMTVLELVDKYIEMHKASVKENSYEQLIGMRNRLAKDSFASLQIAEIGISTAKMWLTSLYNSGLAYGTINNYKATIKSAFDMAYDDNLITKNPFAFSLSKIIKNTPVEKRPITNDEYIRLINFARTHKKFSKIVADEVILLYETGVRVSELCGITYSDIDLEQNTLKIERQVLRSAGHPRYVQTPKTQKGKRIIPLSPAARESILNLTINRPKVKEIELDGCKDFLLITKMGNPKLGENIQGELQMLVAMYNHEHPDNVLPHITPHLLRHTFCTRMILSGMNIKAVQYLMGHSTASVTLNVYSHIMSSADAVKEFEAKLPLLQSTPTRKAMLNATVANLLTPIQGG